MTERYPKGIYQGTNKHGTNTSGGRVRIGEEIETEPIREKLLEIKAEDLQSCNKLLYIKLSDAKGQVEDYEKFTTALLTIRTAPTPTTKKPKKKMKRKCFSCRSILRFLKSFALFFSNFFFFL